ncbi:alpha/beta hydrolase [Sulfitobacter sp.]|uniref:alpha/beta hydrolase n=1 Tax=Sulfitobacter sp. TaxID=1903071 RepID=UPI003EF844FC
MKRWGKWLRRVLLVAVVVPCLMWLFGPYEPTYVTTRFDESKLDKGVGTYLRWREAQVEGITEGVEKQVIWADGTEVQTDWAVVYLHGFSATSQEIRPVPDDVADALGANLVLTRLTGHGLDGDALAQATVQDWIDDTVEAIALGRKVGRKVVLIGTSTGGTLAVAVAVDYVMANVEGFVLISPNFGINNPLAKYLTWPAARYWMPLIGGAQRSFEPLNAEQAKYWTTEYLSVAVMPMAALVDRMAQQNFGVAVPPALFMFSDEDRVVDAQATRRVVADWFGLAEVWQPELTEADDPYAHVIAGDIMSPAQTGAVASKITEWIGALQ